MVKYVTRDFHNKNKKSMLSPEDIIISRHGDSGTAAVIPRNITESNCLNVVVVKKSPKMNSYFISFLFNSGLVKKLLNKTKAGSVQGVINTKEINNALMPYPPLPEQQKIADILSTVDEQIEQTDQLIEKTKELKKGLMKKLLTKGIGHTKFKKTEVGEIPDEWEVRTIKEVTSLLKDGTHNPPPRTERGRPLLSAENIFNNKINFGINGKFISIDSYNEMHKKYEISKGDVLLTIVGTIGRTAVVKNEDKFAVQRSVAILRPNNIVESFFLHYTLNSFYFKKQLLMRANTTAQSGIYLGELSKMSVLTPPIYEQNKISNILSSVDNQIEQYEIKKQRLEQLKKGLMQQLLTGKIRVKVS